MIMNAIKLIRPFVASAGMVFLSLSPEMTAAGEHMIVANPMNLNYQFQPVNDNDPSRREAADPVCEYFKGAYYLFASKSTGYWRSEDLSSWTYVPCTSIPTINDYAPTILPMDDALYFTASTSNTRIFKTSTPEDGSSWVEVECNFDGWQHDPAFYLDDDGRVYLYWGCSDKDPIYGVELDPADGFRKKGEPVVLISHNIDEYGWEVPGVNNDETNHNGYNEGPAMLKYNGKYYLQYAAPGTQWRTYGDGLYVSESPLGPYRYVEDSPFSIKHGGFVGGAGHGHTFKDRYGNYWHVATMCICERHMFERRLGLFPVSVDENGMRAWTLWSDYPFEIPSGKVDFSETALSKGWRQLAAGKTATASSQLPDHEAPLAADERIESWWSAATGSKGEWLMIDLGTKERVCAIQVNFADHQSTVDFGEEPMIYRYVIEASDNGRDWTMAVDRSGNDSDSPHELFVLESPIKARYVRIKNVSDLSSGCFSLYDLRVFGGKRLVSREVKGATIVRDESDKRVYRLSWNPVKGASGYVIEWGVDPENLTHSTMVSDTMTEMRCFNRDSEYYFRVTSF